MNTYQNEIKENEESLRVEITQEEDFEVEVTQEEDFEEITQEEKDSEDEEEVDEEDSEDEKEVEEEDSEDEEDEDEEDEEDEDEEDEDSEDEEDVNGVSLAEVGSDKNPLCNDIIGNILDFTGLDPSFAFVSKQWKGEVQNQMLKECTIQSIIFPNTFQIPSVLPKKGTEGIEKVVRKSLLSKNFTQIKNKSYARKLETYVRQLESWVNDDGEDLDLIDSPQIKKLPSKIFKDHLTNQDLDEKDIICLFTQEWREYFTSLRNRLHTIPLMFLFPNHFLDKINRLSEEWISSALNDVTWEDRLDVSKMSVFPVCDLYITVHIVQQTHLLYNIY